MAAKLWLPPLVFVAALYLAREVLTPFVIAAVLAYVFSPVVGDLSRRLKVPRVAVVSVLYIAVLGLAGLGIWLAGGQLAREVRLLSLAGPDLVDAAVVRLFGNESFHLFGQRVDPHLLADWINGRVTGMMSAPSDAIHLVEQVFETVLKVFLTLIALFYLLLDGHRLGPYLG